ncbi:MAG: putative major pilin subunit [Lentisphaerae bacterium ADurb.Bin242]|nr:MAG: putative major pilin subunit [Lentisphaerae bacterium ADurb.Bin242]
MKKKQESRAGFTLIELLIVVAIIAILAGMLLPALNKTRKTAMGIRCLALLKQTGLGFNLYISDNHEYVLPAIHHFGSGSARFTWMSCISEYLSKPKAKFYVCPGTQLEPGEDTINSYYLRYSVNQSAFTVAALVTDDPNCVAVKKMNCVQHPSEFISMMDRYRTIYFSPGTPYWDVADHMPFCCASDTRGFKVLEWHNRNLNTLRFDGHADSVRLPLQSCTYKPWWWSRNGTKGGTGN